MTDYDKKTTFDENIQLYHGDCLNVMSTLKERSIFDIAQQRLVDVA